ncbi:TPA: 50S ribosomal protein L10 [Staphylococcus pseudintermedius]|nr:50S ribosomal protein L10 [Staphylococcus pseudintermedius]
MSGIIEAKKQQVDVIADQLKGSVSTVVVDYRGLTVAEVTELRKQLREANVQYKVYKNTMLRRAAEKAGIEGLDEFLTGPTAVAFTTEDVVAPAKVIAGFAKEHEALEIKSGIMEGSVITADEVKTVGSLPSHEGLVSMLLSVLQAPMRNFAYAVKAVGESKEENAKKRTQNN